jgi:hypothetical protein
MKIGGRKAGIPGVVAVAALLAMTGCGGGETETVTVAKVLGPAAMSLFPDSKASQSAVEDLARLGVASLSKKCGRLASAEQAGGELLLNAGGTPTYVVLVEVDAADVAMAKEAGYIEATGDFMKAVAEMFECGSKSL